MPEFFNLTLKLLDLALEAIDRGAGVCHLGTYGPPVALHLLQVRLGCASSKPEA
jgi:hypothetical protein